MILNYSKSLFKRFGRLLNNEASEPTGTEALMFLWGHGCLRSRYDTRDGYLRDFKIRLLALSTTEVSRLAR